MALFDNFDDPQKSALMTLALSLLAPKQQKTSFLGDVGQSGLLGMQAYGQAQQQQASLKKEGLQNRLLSLQGDTAQQMLDREKARAAAFQGAFATTPVQGVPQAPQTPLVGQNFMGANPDYTPPPQAPQATQAPVDPRAAMRSMYMNAANKLAAGGFGEDAQKLMETYLKLDPKFASGVNYDQQGRAFIVNETTGQPQFLPGVKARDEIVADNTGGQTRYRTKFSPDAVGAVTNTMTPGDAAHVGIDRARLFYDTGMGGGAPSGPAPGVATGGGAVQASSGAPGAAPASARGVPSVLPPAVQAALAKSQQEGLIKGGVDYKNTLDNTVNVGNDLMMRIGESRNALSQFQPGMGADTRLQIARFAQALPGVDPNGKLVQAINGGDVSAKQEFQKLAAQQAMESLKAAMGGTGRITQAEFKVFQANNPNIELDPRAIDKIYNFAQKIHTRNVMEQSALTDYLGKNGNISQWPTIWTQQQMKAGLMPGSQSQGVVVQTPDGKAHQFPSQAQADAFRKAAGL